MLKFVTAGLTALIVTASPLAHAQTPSQAPSNAGDASSLTDARINAVKAALQLTPDQEKYWPAIEEAIRARAKYRQARIASAAERVDEMRGRSPAEALQNFNPIDLMQRRAGALAQRGANLDEVAEAWKPLYQTLTPQQKLRMALLTIAALHAVRNHLEQQPGMESDADDDYDEVMW